MNTPSHYVFFDVDETLIHCKSMFSFLAFFYQQHYGQDAGAVRYREAMDHLKDLAANSPRSEVNRVYYTLFKGISVADIETCGQQWFTRQQDLFKPTVLARLQQHLAQHHKIVLVSGSLLACLSPIAQQVGAHDILCIQQAQQEGIFTGEIVPPQTIGEGKAVAIKQYLAQQPTDDKHTTVYGDHISDLPMLSLADMPVVVANCPQLIAVAKEAGWEQL